MIRTVNWVLTSAPDRRSTDLRSHCLLTFSSARSIERSLRLSFRTLTPMTSWRKSTKNGNLCLLRRKRHMSKLHIMTKRGMRTSWSRNTLVCQKSSRLSSFVTTRPTSRLPNIWMFLSRPFQILSRGFRYRRWQKQILRFYSSNLKWMTMNISGTILKFIFQTWLIRKWILLWIASRIICDATTRHSLLLTTLGSFTERIPSSKWPCRNQTNSPENSAVVSRVNRTHSTRCLWEEHNPNMINRKHLMKRLS